MKKCKLLITDLDGTLIETVSGNTFPKGIWDMKIKLDVFEAIKNYAPDMIISYPSTILIKYLTPERDERLS